MSPPQNVLIVSNLNSVTTDEDLRVIFGRFGKLKGCEIFKDCMTGQSLEYAFIEFDEQKSCEAAYLKMQNVLFDGRRIHVEYSQIVTIK